MGLSDKEIPRSRDNQAEQATETKKPTSKAAAFPKRASTLS
jgi:hypothetical protein